MNTFKTNKMLLAFRYQLDLQRFAAGDNSSGNPMNVNTTASEGMTKDQKEYYDSELLRNTTPNLVYAQFGKKVPLPQNNGKHVRWRRLQAYGAATTPLQEGITPAGNKPKFENLEATVEQYGDYTVITDRVKMESMDPMIIELTREHGNQGALTIDTVTRDELMTGTNVVYAPKSDGTQVLTRKTLDKTCGLTPNLISMCKTILKKNKAKTIGTDYVAIIHPDLEHDLTTNPDFIDVVKYKDSEKIYNGEIGKLYGVRFVTTPQGKVWKDDTCPVLKANGDGTNEYLAVFGVLFIGAEAYGVVQMTGGNMEMIIKQVGSGGVDDALNQRGSVGWKVTGYATKILNELNIVRAEVCSKDFSEIELAN